MLPRPHAELSIVPPMPLRLPPLLIAIILSRVMLLRMSYYLNPVLRREMHDARFCLPDIVAMRGARPENPFATERHFFADIDCFRFSRLSFLPTSILYFFYSRAVMILCPSPATPSIRRRDFHFSSFSTLLLASLFSLRLRHYCFFFFFFFFFSVH